MTIDEFTKVLQEIYHSEKIKVMDGGRFPVIKIGDVVSFYSHSATEDAKIKPETQWYYSINIYNILVEIDNSNPLEFMKSLKPLINRYLNLIEEKNKLGDEFQQLNSIMNKRNMKINTILK